MPITTCIFDAYGTLFDVSAAARELASEQGQESFAKVWQKLAADWRAKQLQYTWLRAITDAHTDFWTITKDGLDFAFEANKLTDPNLRERLLALYWELSAYGEVPAMLAALKQAGMNTAILSNGSPDMLNGAVKSAGLTDVLDDVLSVQSVGVFKPHHSVYNLVNKRFSCDNDQVLFVSSNGWDAGCATGYGFQTVWVNRANEPVDRLPWIPAHTLPDLIKIPDLAASIK